MTKKDLVIRISNNLDISQSKVTEVVDSFIKEINETLTSGEEVTLRGFGSFSIVQGAARSGRNLKTGQRIVIESKPRIKFKNYMIISSSK